MDTLPLDILLWTVRGLCGFAVLTALAPLLRVGWWPIRLCDFPRMQLGTFAAGVALAATVIGAARGMGWVDGLTVAFAALVAAWQFSHIAPYTRFWRTALPDAPVDPADARTLRLAVLNLDYENERRNDAVRVIASLEVDVLVLVEADQDWIDALSVVRERYPHDAGSVRGEGLGLVVWSTLPLRDARVEHLVSRKRPSVWADLTLRDGRSVKFIAVHPTPPGLDKEDDGEREDSRKRDAELVLVAKSVAKSKHDSYIVAGDFNDVAWSHTTRLFTRLSGLRDPRIGRGLYSTYHADHPLFRYPIDHVFVSEGFAVRDLDRVEIPGSDHLGIVTELVMRKREGASPQPDDGDTTEAAEIVDKGKSDAAKDGE